jgi:hypothetical protein
MRTVLAAATAMLAAAPAQAFTRDRLVLLVDNRSSNGAAADELSPVLEQVIAAKGYEVVPAPEVISALETVHLPAAGDLPPEAAAQIRDALRADAVMLVTVSFFLEARARDLGPTASPAFGLRARMLAASGKVWRNSLGWIADEAPQAGPGFRKAPPRPAATACERLLWSMPRGHRDPSAAPSVLEEIAPPAAPPAVRYPSPVDRKREFPGVAHFPLRIDAP